jgi:CRISPR-associated protein Cmr1
MSRKDPVRTPPEVKKTEKPGQWVTEIRKYKLITPLYGGGEAIHKADSVTTVRAAEVRGQLRFWWRAARGGRFGDVAALRKEEGMIWGTGAVESAKGSGPSDVQITVLQSTEGLEDRPFEVVANKKTGKPNIQPRPESIVPPYAAFPLQPKKEEAVVGMQTLAVMKNIEFTLQLVYPENIQNEIHAALWAWETFGGIGGRTRRGFGALKLDEWLINNENRPVILPSAGQVKKDLIERMKKHGVMGKWPEAVPHLEEAVRMEVFPKTSRSAPQAWKALIGRFQSFRQLGARVNRSTGAHDKFGLSLWPEANVLRSRIRKASKWPDTVARPTLVEKFPRAAFGLPILFHLPHDGNGTYTLQGEKVDPQSDKSFERLASRLILKPLACANHEYVGLAVILVGPSEPPTGLQIKEPLPVHKPVRSKLEPSEAGSEPLNQILHGNPDVLQAFLDYLK